MNTLYTEMKDELKTFLLFGKIMILMKKTAAFTAALKMIYPWKKIILSQEFLQQEFYGLFRVRTLISRIISIWHSQSVHMIT